MASGGLKVRYIDVANGGTDAQVDANQPAAKSSIAVSMPKNNFSVSFMLIYFKD